MVFEYDEAVDALFIWFRDEQPSTEKIIEGEIWPQEAKGHIGLLFDENNKLLGLEILFASNYLEYNYIISKSKKK